MSPSRPHSHAALAREDIEDSKRCAPAGSLEAFAQARGLAFNGQAVMGALAGVLPRWPEEIFNCCQGPIGARYGLVEHELMAIPVSDGDGSIRMNGAFHAVRQGSVPGTKKWMLPGAGVIDLFRRPKPEKEAFSGFAIWVPATTVALRLPEAALLGAFRVRSADRATPLGNPTLDAFGLPGFRFTGEPEDVPQQTRAAILGGAAGQTLAAVRAPYVSLNVHHGQLALTRNGFVLDAAVLDELIAQALAIADAIAAVCRPQDAAPVPFSTLLPPPGPPAPHPVLGDKAVDGWEVDLDRAAAALSMTREDPAAYHAAFPRIPIPGRARGVMVGTLPGEGLPGRLAFHQQGGITRGSMRGAALFAAPPGTPDSQPGGARHERTDMYVEVREGVVFCWSRARTFGEFDATDVAARAQATVRELGLA